MNSSTPKAKQSSFAGFLCPLAFWFGPLFATPIFITLTNQEDVVLSSGLVAGYTGLACLIFSLLGWKLTARAGPRVEWWLNRILLAVSIVTAIQGNVIHELFYYGAFNGEKVNLPL